MPDVGNSHLLDVAIDQSWIELLFEQFVKTHNGIPIDVVVTQRTSVGVDRPEDIDTVIDIIRSQEKDGI